MELNENKNPNPQQDQELSEKAYNELVAVRRDKLKALQEAGNDPFQKPNIRRTLSPRTSRRNTIIWLLRKRPTAPCAWPAA